MSKTFKHESYATLPLTGPAQPFSAYATTAQYPDGFPLALPRSVPSGFVSDPAVEPLPHRAGAQSSVPWGTESSTELEFSAPSHYTTHCPPPCRLELPTYRGCGGCPGPEPATCNLQPGSWALTLLLSLPPSLSARLADINNAIQII